MAIAACAGGLAVDRAVAAPVPLSSLGGASVQTLIDLGSTGVTAGGELYYDFSYFSSATGSGTAPAASAVRVQGVTTADPYDDGLRFVAGLLAADGADVTATVSYDVAPIDPTRGIDQLNLMSNGTAPVAGAGTFVTATELADTTADAPAAPLLTTYDDGRTSPIDTTAPDVDQSTTATFAVDPGLFVTDTLFAASSSAGTGGVATASVVQDLFTTVATTVPEPDAFAISMGAAGALLLGGRRRFGAMRSAASGR